jgi:hypothetical protein
MTSPVLQALANARVAEVVGGLKERDAEISAIVYREIEPPVVADASLPALFAEWCAGRQVSALPTRPATVALFVHQNRHFGLQALVELVDQISAAHVARGLADPCTTYPVPAMLNKIAAINPPRSWSKAEQQRFRSLPYSLQTHVVKREAERDRELKRCQSHAFLWRKSQEKPVENPATTPTA